MNDFAQKTVRDDSAGIIGGDTCTERDSAHTVADTLDPENSNEQLDDTVRIF